ncbi:MAG: DUF5060 domain-containing protein [Bryobacterales bacterium]|nr:DUF5060 domain-containing protein [Bryobacterales bacterium]
MFAGGGRRMAAGGFHDGGEYRVRFSPDTQGEWTYQTRSNRAELNGETERFICGAPSRGNLGAVSVRNAHHFG